MKTEIECRYLECDVEKITNSLEKAGANRIGDWLQLRYCYDFTPKKENSWIRLRTNGETTTLTIKEIVDATVTGTKESEIEVSSFETTNEILNKLGYVARSKQENRRIRYMLDGVEIDIDFWPHIPTYVEMEADSVESIKNVCNKLGIDYSELVTLDVQSIYTHYGVDIDTMAVLLLEEDRKK